MSRSLTDFTIAVAQVSPRLGDVEANLALYEERTRAARGLGADLVVFPELSLTGYFLKDMVSKVAVRLDSPEVRKLAALSRKSALVAGFVEEAPDFRFYNSAAYFEDGQLVHVHRKVYLPTYGLFDEARYFARGNRVRAFDCRFGRATMLVCEDMWHPSTVYVAALDRALLTLCPSSSPLRGFRDDADHDENAGVWERMIEVYAHTYSMFVVYANRVGFEDGVGFWGGSEIVDPTGVEVAKAEYYEQDLIAAPVTMKTARRQRVASPVLRDEDLDLTINELLRIRGRGPEQSPAAPVPTKQERHAVKKKARRR